MARLFVWLVLFVVFCLCALACVFCLCVFGCLGVCSFDCVAYSLIVVVGVFVCLCVCLCVLSSVRVDLIVCGCSYVC